MKAEISEIIKVGDDGFYQAAITLNSDSPNRVHCEAILVLGKDLTECAQRAVLIIEAFKNAK